MSGPSDRPRGAIAWMASNSIAANLSMLILVIGGLIFSTRVTQEVFPEFNLDSITVRVPYPGASPEEVEQGIILAIEDRTARHPSSTRRWPSLETLSGE